MPIPPTPAANPETPPAPPGRTLRRVVWSGVFLLTMMMISLPTVILVGIGMLPTLVAGVIDRSDGKYATFCVCGINFSGLFPFLMEVWFINHSTDMAIRILTDVFNLVIIFGSAALGWVLFVAVPPVITTFLSVAAQTRLKLLKTTQSDITEEWGEKVASTIESQEASEMPPLPDAVPGP